jgi:hypothetical protein
MIRVSNALHSVYTVAHGDGQTTAPPEAGLDVGSPAGLAAQRRAPFIRD